MLWPIMQEGYFLPFRYCCLANFQLTTEVEGGRRAPKIKRKLKEFQNNHSYPFPSKANRYWLILSTQLWKQRKNAWFPYTWFLRGWGQDKQSIEHRTCWPVSESSLSSGPKGPKGNEPAVCFVCVYGGVVSRDKQISSLIRHTHYQWEANC